ncbi:MAG TPA: DNA internalization-related competence protein ComEC/Rec2 [Candidatus Eisenbergiella merdipullorum]|uniref:DNA internalization-related competence protein ComEC/Rec2 n=1 Tax=Candidatus Eisenbergiella merdipullorum TaxID=2838553 RepID=A0A9D2KY97_9FIRM|nr:DNA internalization-related competence protein ComEC/Rec2 [Candidatus Eisenbergiella merdipullorum]
MRRPLVAASLAFVAAVRLATLLRPLPVPEPDRADGQRAVYTGTVSDIICYTDTGTGEPVRLVYLEDAISDPSRSGHSSFQIICRLTEASYLPRIGSLIRCEGEVSHFREASNPGEFNAKEYYNRQGYAFTLRDADVTGSGRDYSPYRQALWQLKDHMGRALGALLSPKDASVMKAMLLGEKKGMDQEVKSLYQAAGISHVVAISGLHISLLGTGVYNLLSRFLGKRFSCAVSAFFLMSFLFMTGFCASSLRAGIMFALSLTARLLGRTYDTATALAAAAALLLMENPAWIDDTGFLLSFTAALSASIVVPAFSEMDGLKDWSLKRVSGGNGKRYQYRQGWLRRVFLNLRSGFRGSFCVSMVTLPLVLSSFYEWNVLSIAVNLVVIPLMGVLLGGCILLAVSGSLLLLFGEKWMFLLAPAAFPVKAILFLYESLCRIGSAGGIGLFRPGAPALWQILLFYAGLLLLLLLSKRLPRIAGYAVCVFLCMIFVIGKPGGTQVTMLDVGQGDCIYIRSQSGRHYLFDGGSSSKPQTGTWQVIPYLKHQGVDRLELIFISHCDSDHISAVKEILEWAGKGNLHIGGLVISASGPEDEMRASLLESAEKNGVPIYRMEAGNEIRRGNTLFQAIYPLSGKTLSDRNTASLVLRFSEYTHGRESFSMLLTGDVEASGEKQILDAYPDLSGGCTILKTAHHGSDTSTTQEFLDAASPKAALISCGRDNSYGHPHEEVLSRFRDAGIPVFITAECGAITVREKDGTVTVQTFL